MNNESRPPAATHSRRNFLKTSATAVATAALAPALPLGVHAAGDDTIKIALVGCGERGTGAAAQALSTKGPTRLVAMADAFEDRLTGSLNGLKQNAKLAPQIDVPPERRFLGLDGYRQAIDAVGKGGVVLLATPPAFRWLHFQHAVAQGAHVFMEKSFAVDAPGVRRVLATASAAKEKNLKVAVGFMWRHDPPREEVIRRIHEGAIGDVQTLRTYRMHGAVGYAPKRPGESDLAHQIRNYNNFTWLNGSFFLDWLCHNLDVCCWAKDAWPVNAQGMGGRCARTEGDQLFDHYFVEYTFADGAKLLAQGRHVNKCYDIFSDFAHGTKGSAVIMESLAAAKPRLYSNQVMTRANEVWRYAGPEPDCYQVEHDLLFDAIRNDKPYNEAGRGAMGIMVGVLGRMAVESGQLLTWEEAMSSNLELAPGLEQMTLESKAPVQPDAQGRYPLAVPGTTKAL
jgi:predicted dehydrogenase